MATKDTTPTHRAVQEYYGKVTQGATPCCGSSSAGGKIKNDLYPAELLAALPPDIASFTAGSGNPISLAELKPGETVLDLGSGAGLDCFLAAKQVGETGRVIGVDMTPEMLSRARSNAARMGTPIVEFREGFLESLPVEDATIDVIISNCVINLSPDKPQVFREMARVLKPGGRIAVSDPISNHPLPKDAGEDKDWCGCTSGALTDAAYAQELSKLGFIDIRIEPDVEMVTNVTTSGQVELPSDYSQEQLLQDVQKWDRCERTMVIPHKITARKPS
jgi:arsenite methyltransferase